MAALFKILLYGIIGFFGLAVIGYYPALTVATTAVVIVFMFLVFGKE